ncbi:hypothetical protein EGT74_24295 [Chitinophaga lutea]|uniref:Uncharacterized protein n=1 Tax=Chitinophaga lutea TaxID=2488634 RepID=A0A3N4PDL1_9BACT|nr:hypothetical protein EGT74_24295 [Chitinophaga lutea]
MIVGAGVVLAKIAKPALGAGFAWSAQNWIRHTRFLKKVIIHFQLLMHLIGYSKPYFLAIFGPDVAPN